MKLRMPWAAAAFLIALALGRQTQSTAEGFDGDSRALRTAQAVTSTESVNKLSDVTTTEVLKTATDQYSMGESRVEVIQHALSTATGEGPMLRWSQERLQKPYRLRRILSHVSNLDTGFELLFSQAWTPGGVKDESLQYSNNLLEADEQNLAAAIVIYPQIQMVKDQWAFDESAKVRYEFSLRPQSLFGSFKPRPPKAQGHVAAAQDRGGLDPLSILTNANGNFDELSDYQKEMPTDQGTFVVSTTPRRVSPTTISIECEIREADSLITHSFVLIYEQTR